MDIIDLVRELELRELGKLVASRLSETNFFIYTFVLVTSQEPCDKIFNFHFTSISILSRALI